MIHKHTSNARMTAEEKTFAFCFPFCVTDMLGALIAAKIELKTMTLCAPRNACAKPQCYFSLVLSSLMLHVHTSRALFPCFLIFTAFLCIEHDRITPLTQPSHRAMTNAGESIQETDQVSGALN